VSAIASAARAAVQILEAAESAGLPLPFTTTASEYRVTIQFLRLDDLAAWSTYLEEPISEEPHEGNTVAMVSASMFEQPLELSAYIRAEVAP
jgi:hypothetical protein